jgi:hypothetical protein
MAEPFRDDLLAELLAAARSLNEYVPPERTRSQPAPAPVNGATGDRPGDAFNRSATWEEILEPHGWAKVRQFDRHSYWRRPGKDKGVSATADYCRSEAQGGLLYVFSSGAAPLEMDTGYSRFAAFVCRNRGGDVSAAMRALAAREPARPNVDFRFLHSPPSSDRGPPPDDGPAVAVSDIATIHDLVRAGAEVEWVWPGWVQRGVLTAIASVAGTGKTRFCADLVRRIRHGLPWPDGQPMTLPPDSRTLWVVADNHHDEMVTLCRDFGIVDAVWLNAPKTDPYAGVSLETSDDLADFDRRIRALRPALVVIDTVGNATDKNLSRQEDAKAFYWPQQVIARKYRTAVLPLTHLNAAGQFLGRRVQEKVRVAIRMERPDPHDERRSLEVRKSNSKTPPALGVTMGDAGNEYDNVPPKAPEDGGGAALNFEQPDSRFGQAVEWLRAQLERCPWRVSDLLTLARNQGHSTKTLYKAKNTVRADEFERQGKKWWRLKTDENA